MKNKRVRSGFLFLFLLSIIFIPFRNVSALDDGASTLGDLRAIYNDLLKEKQEYDNYKDYTMGSIILTFNAMDNINHKYKEIRYQERYIKGKFTPIEDYIFDYISYDYIPIFKYIINKGGTTNYSSFKRWIVLFSYIKEFKYYI